MRRAAEEFHLLFFGRVFQRLSSTWPDSLVNSILNQCVYQLMLLSSPGDRTTKTEHCVLINKSGMREGTPVLK